MYGNSGKLGRGGGGGRGASKRMLHNPLPLPPPHRPAGAARLPIGAASSRNRTAGPGPGSGGAGPHVPEETFSLASNEPLAFSMIMRLTPDLVDEIGRVEAHGGAARIKFGPNSNNPSGNVIDVGGKDFTFTWSRELGDCDIYEERQSGEDGNGLLVESGSVWRKLNIQRILDESTKNHVKMRTEEAERQLKSRKAIVLDPANPSVKNQAKTMVAAALESNSRRMQWKQKKEPAFKKRKIESSPVSFSGPPKSIFKPGVSSKTTAKDRLSVSPLPSPPERLAVSASPLGIGNLSKGQPSADEVITTQVISKEEIFNSEKEMPIRIVHAATQEVSGHRVNVGAAPTDLRSTLINLLLENPKGMSVKALEKAVGDTNPNSGRKIEGIIKKIATYQAPGRYILNPGVELENFKKPSSESGSSPECVGDQTPVAKSIFPEKTTSEEFEPQTQLVSGLGEQSNVLEKINVEQISLDLFGSNNKAGDNSEGRAGSSSESGSDSDSDSDTSDSGSDSGSQSRSRSKSRSPAGSGSGSSSDSESDGSSSGKEGSDEDVDIMTSDDDKDESELKLKVPGLKSCTSPSTWETYDDGHEKNGGDENKLDGHLSSAALNMLDIEKYDDTVDAVDITDESPVDNSVKMCENHKTEVALNTLLIPRDTKTRSMEEPFSQGRYKQSEQLQMSHSGSFVNDTREQIVKQRTDDRQTIVKDSSGPEQFNLSERVLKTKSKRASDLKPLFHEEKPKSAKKLKSGSALQDPYKYKSSPINDKANRDGNAGSGKSMAYENGPWAQIDANQSGQRIGDLNARGRAPDIMERPGKSNENLSRGTKHSERGFSFSNESASRNVHLQPKFQMQKEKLQREMQDEDDKPSTKSFRESGVGHKQLMMFDPLFRKSEEQGGKVKDNVQTLHLNPRSMPEDNSKSDVNWGSMLKRELSDLELGEFREPVPEETHGVKRPFERKNSFKSSENKSNASDNPIYDFGKGRPTGKVIQESKKPSPPNQRVGGHCNQDGLFRKKLSEEDLEDPTRPQQRFIPSQAQQFPRIDRSDAEAGSHLDKLADMASKVRKNEAKENPGSTLESHMKMQQHDPKHAGQLAGFIIVKEAKLQKSNTLMESADKKKDSIWTENNSNGGKRRESSSDEDNSLFSKYEKDKPELKGPIEDYAQYKEYVEEYKEKYDCYCSLNTILENYRSDFLKLGHDLELAKGRDMDAYYNIQEQIKETYRQCRTRHQRLKNVFIVLHEELKVLKQRIKEFAEEYTKD